MSGSFYRRGLGQELFSRTRTVQGFTLVEVLVVIAIFSVMIAAVYQMFLLGERSWSSDMELLNLQQPVRRGYYAMTQELRAAATGGVSIPSSCNHLDSPDSCTRITFSTPTENDITYFYNAVSNQVIRQDNSGRQRVLAGDITGLFLCCAHSGGSCGCDADHAFLSIRLEAAKAIKGEDESFVLEGKLRFRNE